MVSRQRAAPTAPTLTSTAAIESVLKKYREGLVTEKSLIEALEASVNRLEHSGAETGGDTANAVNSTHGRAKSLNSKDAFKAESRSFRLEEVNFNLLFLQEEQFKACTPSCNTSTSTPHNKRTSLPSDNDPIVIDAEVESISDGGRIDGTLINKKKRLSNDAVLARSQGEHPGRWLQLRDIDAKIWVSAV